MCQNTPTESLELPVARHPGVIPNTMRATLLKGITPDQLSQIYADPYIERVGHDGRKASPVIHPLATYLSAFVGDKFVGAFLAIRFSHIEIECHALLHKSAVHQSRALAKEFLDWAFAQPILRVTAYVIEGLESAKNFCLKVGMRLEGFRRSACLKNGKACGVYVLGITREEWSKA